MSSGVVLLKNLLLSSSRINVYRHSRDKKTRGKIVRGGIGTLILYVMLMAYCIVMCVGYGQFGLIDTVPVTCALLVSALAFVLTLFKTNGYLFNFSEYDMLMSLPFETRTVAACKFLHMYVKSLPSNLCISLSMMIGYGIFAHPPVITYPLWLVLSLFLPAIPMLAASFLGFLVARISAGFRRANLVQAILTLAFVLFCFSLRFIIEDLIRNDKVQATLETASAMTNDAARAYLPAGWFADAVVRLSLPGILLLVLVSVALFMAMFAVMGHSYRRINSALRSRAASRSYRMSAQRQHNVVWAIAYKEWKRMAGSTTYLVNVGIGVVLAAVVGVVTLVIGPEKLLQTVTQDAPISAVMLRPAIPFIVYFFIGMVATTACSPSLEGKNFWILQSLPVEMSTVYQGKMLFNMVLTVPFMAFSTLCLCVAGKVPVLDTCLYLLLGLALCAFSTAWGCVCGVRHMRLDWENEVEVIKQGAAVIIYLLPNMLVVIGLTVLVVYLGTRMDHRLLTAAGIVVAGTLAALSYSRVLHIAGTEGR